MSHFFLLLFISLAIMFLKNQLLGYFRVKAAIPLGKKAEPTKEE